MVNSGKVILPLLFITYAYCIEPLTIGIGAGVASLLGYKFDFLKENTYCRFTECCNDEYITANISNLERELKHNLYGQHIVIQQLIPALKAHFSSQAESRKALVLSLHGTPGTGKNFVTEFLIKSLYKNGLESKFVHIFKGRSDFPLEHKVNEYKHILTTLIKESIQSCPRSLFVFDEVDKMPPGIFDSLPSLVDYSSSFKGKVYSSAIFVLISNTAGIDLSMKLHELMHSGILREQTKLKDFEKTLEFAAYNREGGLRISNLIDTHVIDHFIPFLPLEKEHVIKCILSEFRRWNYSPTDQEIEDIIESAVSFEKTTGLFAKSGCKTLEKKVAVAVKYSS